MPRWSLSRQPEANLGEWCTTLMTALTYDAVQPQKRQRATVEHLTGQVPCVSCACSDAGRLQVARPKAAAIPSSQQGHKQAQPPCHAPGRHNTRVAKLPAAHHNTAQHSTTQLSSAQLSAPSRTSDERSKRQGGSPSPFVLELHQELSHCTPPKPGCAPQCTWSVPRAWVVGTSTETAPAPSSLGMCGDEQRAQYTRNAGTLHTTVDTVPPAGSHTPLDERWTSMHAESGRPTYRTESGK